MPEKNLLQGKKILVVDDEVDVLETVRGILSMCDLTLASTFEEGKKQLETARFDLAILDIMGVNGFALLEIANQKKVMAVMLTAHAHGLDTTVRSFKEGAVYYVPKETMAELPKYLTDIFETVGKGGKPSSRWLERFASYYENWFGPKWKENDKDFWKRFGQYM